MFEKQFSPGRANLSMGNVANFIVPVPPYCETDEIIGLLAHLHAIVDQLETQSTKSQHESDLLMQAVLKEAFEG